MEIKKFDKDLYKILQKLASGTNFLLEKSTFSFSIKIEGMTMAKVASFIEILQDQGILRVKKRYWDDDPRLDTAFQHVGKTASLFLLEVNGSKLKTLITEQERLEKLGEPWSIFSCPEFKLSYHNGGFFFNDEKEPYLSLQNNKIPKRLWNLAEKENRLYFESEALYKEFGLMNENKAYNDKTVFDTFLKNHKTTFMEKLKEKLKSRNITSTVDLKATFLLLESGNLFLVKNEK